MKKSIIIKTLRNVSLAVIYILLISQLMTSGDAIFGSSNANEAVIAFFMLMLFSLSAAIVGGLVFGESIRLFLSDKKKDSLLAILYSISWLAVYTILGMLLMIIIA